jgi:hypothetical protein
MASVFKHGQANHYLQIFIQRKYLLFPEKYIYILIFGCVCVFRYEALQTLNHLGLLSTFFKRNPNAAKSLFTFVEVCWFIYFIFLRKKIDFVFSLNNNRLIKISNLKLVQVLLNRMIILQSIVLKII